MTTLGVGGQSTFGQMIPGGSGTFSAYPGWQQFSQQYGAQNPLQQLLAVVPQQLQQILQVVPQQVQQVHQLQQQILQLQQWVQAVPLQLLQLQQLIQTLPHQLIQLQQSHHPFQSLQPFGSQYAAGVGGFGGGFSQPNAGINPQQLGFSGQTGPVM